jgi:alanine-glyoxylate transaminase/serine-glyoxylate transaminase/serine-pyruvate transaminase
MGYWGSDGQRSYHHTAPVNSLYGFHEALVILQEEGLENSWTRHQYNHNALKAGVEAMGLSFFVDEAYRLPQLNAVTIPEGIDEAAVRSTLLNSYNLEIGAGLGPMAGKIWRIGLMGFASTETNVLNCLGALDAVLSDMGADIQSSKAVSAAKAAYAA